MGYNSEALEITVVISGNGLLFKYIKISLGLLTFARKKHALCRENHKFHLSTNTLEPLFSKPIFQADLSA